jgi:hypothetical protein
MKSVTEFWSATLTRGLKAKEALAAEGKSPEEIQTNLGETFKMEGDKLKHFIAALDVAAQNQDKLSRVLVVALNEGESAPPKGVKVEENYYIPEFQVAARAVNTQKFDRNAAQGGKGKGKGSGPKSSPWGLTPEEKAAKGKGGGGSKPPAAT